MAIILVYVFLYTPVYDTIFGYKPPREYQAQAPLVLPKMTPATSEAFKKAAVVTKEALSVKVARKATREAEKVAKKATVKPLKAASRPSPEATAEIELPKFVNLRDPFMVDFAYTHIEAPPEEKKTATSAPAAPPKTILQLQGIFISGDMRSAIIDDRIVYEGSQVASGWKVSEIRLNMVILTQAGKIKTLRMR